MSVYKILWALQVQNAVSEVKRYIYHYSTGNLLLQLAHCINVVENGAMPYEIINMFMRNDLIYRSDCGFYIVTNTVITVTFTSASTETTIHEHIALRKCLCRSYRCYSNRHAVSTTGHRSHVHSSPVACSRKYHAIYDSHNSLSHFL